MLMHACTQSHVRTHTHTHTHTHTNAHTHARTHTQAHMHHPPASMCLHSRRSPARSSGVDDVRVVAKDKSRHRRGPSAGSSAYASPAKASPRASATSRLSPLPSLSITESGDWKAMYTTTSATTTAAAAGAGAGAPGDSSHHNSSEIHEASAMRPSSARTRARSLFVEAPDQVWGPCTCMCAARIRVHV